MPDFYNSIETLRRPHPATPRLKTKKQFHKHVSEKSRLTSRSFFKADYRCKKFRDCRS
ncbi:hypothetical protein PUN28_008973 [Cardiocondyla obscurior]|uniref:Uncharacterized protein n=1 Tax=Cardiocondyla obscurior TaxID=286306 RepID=A0AAW2FVB9_9HYME